MEIPGQRPPSDHRPPSIDPENDPPFGEPQTPDGPGEGTSPTRPRLGEPHPGHEVIETILKIIAQLLTPPDPPDPDTDLDPDGKPTDEYIEKVIDELGQQIADVSAAVANEVQEIYEKSAQAYGTAVHKIFEELVKSEVDSILKDLLGDDWAAHAEASILKAMHLQPNPDTGRFEWAPRGTKGTVRPDLIITRMVEQTVGGVTKAMEEVVRVIDLKTGNAEISKTWRTAVINATGVISAVITALTPDPRLSQPPKTTTAPATSGAHQ
ncbi:hypothetical protein GOEFS_035_00500 [Gordonia effusa NBRC 100432]|uniref:Uncharacterized protein n=1 Tax=Gordonia effusa NBRC 100432 TaxID=1077974 RepID=H0QXG7_9ACTN|nr:hypothetical protein [Gordonia effusa]GAB17518.1 hypothetical protein GOEFS_035_00500 [Gordonia effusa NBRC 100432]